MSFIFPPLQPNLNSIVYVVIEITDPDMYFDFGINQKQYIKYHDKKQLAIIGTYEDLAGAEAERAKGHGRHILSSEFHRSIFPKPITLPDTSKPFSFPEPNKPFGFPEPNKPFGFSEQNKPFGFSEQNKPFNFS